MRKRRTIRAIVALSALLTCSGVTAIVAPTTSQAAIGWPQAILSNGELTAAPDGSVVTSQCYAGWNHDLTYPPATAFFGQSGQQQLLLRPPMKSPTLYRFCGEEHATGRDGTFYGERTENNQTTASIVAYRAGKLLWSTPLTRTCGTSTPRVSSMATGSTGELYAVVISSCEISGRTRFSLIGLNHATGKSLFSKVIGDADGSWAWGGPDNPVLAAYKNGLILRQG